MDTLYGAKRIVSFTNTMHWGPWVATRPTLCAVEPEVKQPHGHDCQSPTACCQR